MIDTVPTIAYRHAEIVDRIGVGLRFTGDRLKLESAGGAVHGLATYDGRLLIYNVLVWSFSKDPAQVQMTLEHVPAEMVLRKVTLDAAAVSDDDNSRLRPTPSQAVAAGTNAVQLDLAPYGIVFFSLESRK